MMRCSLISSRLSGRVMRSKQEGLSPVIVTEMLTGMKSSSVVTRTILLCFLWHNSA